MTELLDIQFPRSIQELDSFTTKKNIEALLSLYQEFWNKCAQITTEEEISDEEDSVSPCLDISTIQKIKDDCIDRTRESTLKF